MFSGDSSNIWLVKPHILGLQSAQKDRRRRRRNHSRRIYLLFLTHRLFTFPTDYICTYIKWSQGLVNTLVIWSGLLGGQLYMVPCVKHLMAFLPVEALEITRKKEPETTFLFFFFFNLLIVAMTTGHTRFWLSVKYIIMLNTIFTHTCFCVVPVQFPGQAVKLAQAT